MLAFFGCGYLAFRRRAIVGSIRLWTILLIISAIVAPLSGKIGRLLGN